MSMSYKTASTLVKHEKNYDDGTLNVVPSALEFSDVVNDPGAEKMDMGREDMLREFDILDEFGNENEENMENSSSCSSYGEDLAQHSDFLEESDEDPNNLQDSRSKTIFDVSDEQNHQPLPPGWIKIIHDSGIPVYLHKDTRVCMVTRPYYLGVDSVRKHKIPASCVPCLQYDKLKTELLSGSASATEKGNEGEPMLSSEMLSHYCSKLFRFKTIKVMRFNTWADRRLYTKNKMLARQDRKSPLPAGAKIVEIPSGESSKASSENSKDTKRAWLLNPNGKSCVCLLHEYVQHALKKHPSYTFSELENAKTPYSAAVVIDGMQYGVGFGSSKKQAKLEAARATLEVLIPDMQDQLANDPKVGQGVVFKPQRTADISIFDDIKIEDPRVAELCARTTEPYPYAVLLDCIKRNFGLTESDVKFEDKSLGGGEHEFTIRVGNYSANVKCHNKRKGKQRTAQAILKQLHPHVESWGSLLRMYGNCSVKSFKKKRDKKREQIFIQPPEPDRKENTSILSRLRAVMSEAEKNTTELPQYCQRIKKIEELIKQKYNTPEMDAVSCETLLKKTCSHQKEMDLP